MKSISHLQHLFETVAKEESHYVPYKLPNKTNLVISVQRLSNSIHSILASLMHSCSKKGSLN